MLGRPLGRSLRYLVNTDSVAGDVEVKSAAHRLLICQQDPPSCGSTVTDMANQSEAMKDDVMNQMNRTQVDIDIIISGFAECGNLSGSAVSHMSAFATKVEKHTQCRQNQATMTTLYQTYAQLVRASSTNVTSQCGADILTKPVADYQPICKPSSQVPLQQWFESMASQFADLKLQWIRQNDACESARLEYTKFEKERLDRATALKTLTLTCDSELAEMESFACAWASQYKSRCSTYESCYTRQEEQLKQKIQTIQATINQWKNTWTAASKMECMGRAVSGSTVDYTKMQLCDAANLTNTSHINIVIPRVPLRQACPAPEIYPGSTQYRQMVYGALPAGVNVRVPTLCLAWKEGCQKHASFSESVVRLSQDGKSCGVSRLGEVLCQGAPGLFVFKNSDSNCNSGRGILLSVVSGPAQKCRFDPSLPPPSIRCGDNEVVGNPNFELSFRLNPVATSISDKVSVMFDGANGGPLEFGGWRDWSQYDEPFLLNCGEDAMTHINSIHDNRREDRKFRYSCSFRKTAQLSFSPTGFSEWTQYDADWTYECPSGHVLNSIEGIHDNAKEDRRYRFKCGRVPNGVQAIPGAWPGNWQNDWDGE